MRFLKKLQRDEKQHTVSEMAEVEIKEQEVETDVVDHRVEDEEPRDPALVEQKEEKRTWTIWSSRRRCSSLVRGERQPRSGSTV